MRINGEWFLFDDDILRPVIRGEISTEAGAWQQAEFLVDTGADRTVFSAATASKLGLQSSDLRERISGLGGAVNSVVVQTKIQLTRETGSKVTFSGE